MAEDWTPPTRRTDALSGEPYRRPPTRRHVGRWILAAVLGLVMIAGVAAAEIVDDIGEASGDACEFEDD